MCMTGWVGWGYTYMTVWRGGGMHAATRMQAKRNRQPSTRGHSPGQTPPSTARTTQEISSDPLEVGNANYLSGVGVPCAG